jgi:hypothetical protein
MKVFTVAFFSACFRYVSSLGKKHTQQHLQSLHAHDADIIDVRELNILKVE